MIAQTLRRSHVVVGLIRAHRQQQRKKNRLTAQDSRRAISLDRPRPGTQDEIQMRLVACDDEGIDVEWWSCARERPERSAPWASVIASRPAAGWRAQSLRPAGGRRPRPRPSPVAVATSQWRRLKSAHQAAPSVVRKGREWSSTGCPLNKKKGSVKKYC